MAIQMRRGNLVNYDEDKMLPGEFGVALDEKELYIAFGSGDSKRVLTEDDIQEVDNSLDAYSENPVQNKVLKSALDEKAPKASPTFTGTPKAPTAAAGTNNTQIATTAFVHDVVDAKTRIWYGTCETSNSTAQKIVTLDNADGFSLTDGTIIMVDFLRGNYGSHPTLNVNGTGAKEIVYQTSSGAGAVMYAISPYYQFGIGYKFFEYKSQVQVAGSNGYWVMLFPDFSVIEYLVEGKADIYSPTLEGVPKAPTPSLTANNTEIATTAFVRNAIDEYGGGGTITATDKGSGVVELSIT